jgi:hypothetical protein
VIVAGLFLSDTHAVVFKHLSRSEQKNTSITQLVTRLPIKRKSLNTNHTLYDSFRSLNSMVSAWDKDVFLSDIGRNILLGKSNQGG